MDRRHCCVCGAAIEGNPSIFGGRAYCELHYASVHQDRKGLWTSSLLSIVAMVLLTVAAWGVERTGGGGLSDSTLMMVAAVLAVIPPFLWLGIFYRMDRFEPEPKAYIAKVAILGALVQQALYVPIAGLLLPSSLVSEKTSFTVSLLYLICAAGFEELLKLLTVRYGVFAAEEFDEKIDGIIYGSAAGLGFATMANFQYIFIHGGASLTASAANIVVTSLASASFGGLTGYFLAVTKFEKKPFWWLPAGVLAAIAGNVCVAELMQLFARRGFQVNHLLGVIPAAVVAAGVFGVLMAIIRRDQKAASARVVEGQDESTDAGAAATQQLIRRQIRFEGILLWAMVALVLVGGIAFNLSKNAFVRTNAVQAVTVGYPSSWTGTTQVDGSFAASEFMMPGTSGMKLTVQSIALPESAASAASTDQLLSNLAGGWTIRSSANYAWYSPVSTRFKLVGGKPAAIVEYLFASELPKRDGASVRPIQGTGCDVIVPVGDRQIIISLTGDSGEDGLNDMFDRVLRSVEWN